MFCKYCGSRLPDGANFCPSCGGVSDDVKKTEYHTNETFVAEPLYTPEQELERNNAANSILTLGILGLAFSFWPVLSILGLIFTGICRSKHRRLKDKYSDMPVKASVGKGLSNGGLPAGIFFTIFWTLYILIIVAAVASTVGGYSDYNDIYSAFHSFLNF